MRLTGIHWNETILHSLGAVMVTEVEDEAGALIGYDVEPTIDVSGYAAAVAEKGRQDLIAYAARKRWEVETGGIAVDGAIVATDRESQAMVNGAFNYVQVNPGATVKYKAATGFVDCNKAEIEALAGAIGAHVQACFAKEADVLAAIEAGGLTIQSEIDAAFADL